MADFKVFPNKHHKKQLDNDHEENRFQEVMFTFDEIVQMRFIERVSRPMQSRKREQFVIKFQTMVDYLHSLLQKIQNQANEKNSQHNMRQNNFKGKSISVGSVTSKKPEWKKGIRAIEQKYYEIFTEGNFKHYKKIASLLNINKQIQTINIQIWANLCLRTRSKSKGCCD